MANSFFQSLSPDIAAAVVKIDANKTVIDENKVILVDVHDTDLPAAKTVIDENKVILVDLHDTDLPGAVTKIDDNKTVVDAIKLKTDATPQHVRGKFYMARLSTTSATFAEVLNVSGRGILKHVVAQLGNSGDTFEVRVTLDGTVFDVPSYSGSTNSINLVPAALPADDASMMLVEIAYAATSHMLFNTEFQNNCTIELRRSAGSSSNVHCKAFYTLDQF